MLGCLSRLYGDAFGWRTDAYEFVKDRLAIDLLFGGDEARLLVEDRASVERLEQHYENWCAESTGFHQNLGDARLYPRST